MSKPQSQPVRELPKWVIHVGSVVILFHLFALTVLALGARSGPWPTPYGTDMAMPPQFAGSVDMITTRHYLSHLGMTHNYHFISNRTSADGVEFEVLLKYKDGKVKTLRFPEKNANFWVRYRQQLLAQGLANDEPVQPRGPEKVAATGSEVEKVDYWLRVEEVRKLVADNVLPSDVLKDVVDNPLEKTTHLIRVTIPEDQEGVIPRDRPMARPSAWSLLLAESYMRYLCREHNAESAELLRYSRPPVFPAYMFMNVPPQDAFSTMISHFGDLKRDFEEQ